MYQSGGREGPKWGPKFQTDPGPRPFEMNVLKGAKSSELNKFYE